ncbi:MAG: hypothetical protein OXG36_10425 [Caldilineaceae bacterium]|nr:hypothetical protein [Caldilineaceae bacterium]
MEKDSGDKHEPPIISGSVEVEWNWDLDDQWRTINQVNGQAYKPGEEAKIRVKGRCKRCWGGLIAKRHSKHPLDAIRCRVCGKTLEGDKAREEFQRMSDEGMLNTLSVVTGLAQRYSDKGEFVQKLFPPMERLSEDEFRQRVKAQAGKAKQAGWLTRSDFPEGSAGFLFLQARALMSGVERLPREMSAVQFPDFDRNDDGSATVYLSKEELSLHSKTREYELMKRLGSTMTVIMMSAFACELVLKAIRLTRKDTVRKSHDLLRLYHDLPCDSRQRIEADFPGIESTLKHGRHTFDKWRYFESNQDGRGMSAMIDTERAFALAKAVRVILDEAEIAGLKYSVRVHATQTNTRRDDREDIFIKQDLSVIGTEAPLTCHKFLLAVLG